MGDYLRDPAEIYRRSFAAIRAEADLARLPRALEPMAVRLIHACGMIDIIGDLAFSPDVAEAGCAALAAAAPILCDGRMVADGVLRARLLRANEIICAVDEAGIAADAVRAGTTRAHDAVRDHAAVAE